MSTFVYRKRSTWLDLRDIPCRPASRYQLKIGRGLSYDPTRGTTFVKGNDRARRRAHLSGRREVLVQLGYLSENDGPTLSEPAPLKQY